MSGLNIMFISYWGINEGLTQATVIPHLKILSEFEQVNSIIYVSIERDNQELAPLSIDKVVHKPIYSKNIKPYYLNKIYDFIWIPKSLIGCCITNSISKVICRGSPAGALGWMIWRKTKISFYVESFEPHADYMLESKVWKKYDPRYWLQKYWEKKQRQTATLLMPVAKSYGKFLLESGIREDKIFVVPCGVDTAKFKFNNEDRIKIRKHYKIPTQSFVGVYVGKFGGMYLDYEALYFVKRALQNLMDLYVIIISPSMSREIETEISNISAITKRLTIIMGADQEEIAQYLSAADFGFAFYKPTPSTKYLSPIKFGEYWASGLPILSLSKVGDEHGFKMGFAHTINNHDEVNVFFSKRQQLTNIKFKNDIVKFAQENRGYKFVSEAYEKVLSA